MKPTKREQRERDARDAYDRAVTPPEMLAPIRDIIAKLDQIMASPEWARASVEQRDAVETLRDTAEHQEAHVRLSYGQLRRSLDRVLDRMTPRNDSDWGSFFPRRKIGPVTPQ
jgi:hypothetical protein